MFFKLPLIIELNKKGYMWGRVEGVGNYVPKGEGENYSLMLENIKSEIQKYVQAEGKEDKEWSEVNIERIKWDTYIDRSGTDTGNVHPVMKMWYQLENLNTEQYGLLLQEKIRILLELVNQLHIKKAKVNDVTVWIEPLLFKFCFHTISTVNLFYGTDLPLLVNNKPFKIFDEPSMLALFRSSLENYLTFYYLYVDNIPKEEQTFRMLVYRYSGTKQRSEFIVNTLAEKEKQKRESEYCEILKQQVSSNEFFKMYNSEKQRLILEGKKPRLFETWKSILQRSHLHSELFRNIYSYKSIYSHSEFISLLQMKESNYGYDPNSTKSHHWLLLLHGLICKTIIEFKDLFPEAKTFFEKLSEASKDDIVCIYEFIIGKAPLQEELNAKFA
jgi:hypothetical protein